MEHELTPSWKKILQDHFGKESWRDLSSFIDNEYKAKAIYPKRHDIFNAFKLCPFEDIRVVILGQDPYHGPEQAHGLSFSVPDSIQTPPSLRNIFKELSSDLNIESSGNNLESWAKQGVLLLNSVLTVEHKSPASHTNQGWEEFTDHVIKAISDNREHVVFLLWGAYAQKKGSVINTSKHLVLSSTHPSPFSAYKGFLGSKPFSQTNTYLQQNSIKTIDW